LAPIIGRPIIGQCVIGASLLETICNNFPQVQLTKLSRALETV